MSSETSAALNDAAEKDITGQTSGGKDAHNNDKGQTVMGEAGKEKTAKESTEDSEPT